MDNPAYQKGLESGRRTIGNTLNDTLRDDSSRTELVTLITYMWGTRDAYDEILSKYLTSMIPISTDGMDDVTRSLLLQLTLSLKPVVQTAKDVPAGDQVVSAMIDRMVEVITVIIADGFGKDTTAKLMQSAVDKMDELITRLQHDTGDRSEA